MATAATAEMTTENYGALRIPTSALIPPLYYGILSWLLLHTVLPHDYISSLRPPTSTSYLLHRMRFCSNRSPITSFLGSISYSTFNDRLQSSIPYRSLFLLLLYPRTLFSSVSFVFSLHSSTHVQYASSRSVIYPSVASNGPSSIVWHILGR